MLQRPSIDNRRPAVTILSIALLASLYQRVCRRKNGSTGTRIPARALGHPTGLALIRTACWNNRRGATTRNGSRSSGPD